MGPVEGGGPFDDTLESPATLAPPRDSPSPLPSPPAPPPLPCLDPQLAPVAVHGAAEEAGSPGEVEAGQADSVCKVMGMLGMGHRLFVPRLLAVREREKGGGAGKRGTGLQVAD